jgi:hypothetical protein
MMKISGFKTIIFSTHSIVKYVEPHMMLLQHWKQMKRVSTMSQTEKRLHHGNNNAMISDRTGCRFHLARVGNLLI